MSRLHNSNNAGIQFRLEGENSVKILWLKGFAAAEDVCTAELLLLPFKPKGGGPAMQAMLSALPHV